MIASSDRRRSRAASQRLTAAWLAAAAVVVGLCSVAVTGCGEPVTEPSVGTIDLTPDVMLVVDDDGLRWAAATSAVSTDPARWATGTLLEVRNDGDEPHRVRAGRRFDTGTLQPGETTLVLFDDELTATTSYEVVDADDPDRTVTFELVPAPVG